MTTIAGTFSAGTSRKAIEHAIAELYAAGLDLQTSGASRDVPAATRAMMPEYVRRIGEIIEDLRIVAGDVSSIRPA